MDERRETSASPLSYQFPFRSTERAIATTAEMRAASFVNPSVRCMARFISSAASAESTPARLNSSTWKDIVQPPRLILN
jgi:hypothetical protein